LLILQTRTANKILAGIFKIQNGVEVWAFLSDTKKMAKKMNNNNAKSP